MSEQVPAQPPSDQDYLRAVNAAIHSDNINSKEALNRVIIREASRSRAFAIAMTNAIHWGKLIEPFDRTTESIVHTGRPVTEAVRLGSGFGLLLIPNAHENFITIDDVTANIPTIDQPDPSDTYHYYHEIASQIVELGEEGLQFLGPEVDDQLMDLEMRIVNEVEHQRMFRIGCGIVALGGYIAHEKRLTSMYEAKSAQNSEVEDVRSMLENDIDWDGALIDLLSDK